MGHFLEVISQWRPEVEKDVTRRGIYGWEQPWCPTEDKPSDTKHSRPREEWDRMRLGARKESEHCSVVTHILSPI